TDVSLVDVGEHEMRGLRRSENLFLLDAPGLESSDAAHRIGEPEVVRSDDLVGRVEDLERVEDALATSAIVTITGPGGIGKTRLLREARTVVARVQAYDRSYNIELAGARDRVAVEGAFHAALISDDALDSMASQRGGREAPQHAVDEFTQALGSRRAL